MINRTWYKDIKITHPIIVSWYQLELLKMLYNNIDKHKENALMTLLNSNICSKIQLQDYQFPITKFLYPFAYIILVGYECIYPIISNANMNYKSTYIDELVQQKHGHKNNSHSLRVYPSSSNIEIQLSNRNPNSLNTLIS